MPELRPDRDELPPIVLMWESFGPSHHDRLRALSRAGFEVHAIELSSHSRDYAWERDALSNDRVQTLDDRPGGRSGPVMVWRLLRACLRSRAKHVFLCHYERPEVFAAVLLLRALGRRVFAMIDSKFDDYARSLRRELGKSLFLAPYSGALVAGRRSRDYVAFLGIPAQAIELGYDTIDVERWRAASAGSEEPFATRPFLVVARLVAKKNLSRVLEAFALYRERHPDRRELHVIGYGPLREALEAEAESLGLAGAVRFLGAQDSAAVAQAMARAVALILASTEEQFGLVVNEAFAAGLPAIVSSNAGAVDVLVRNLDNGIVVDPYDVESIVLAMAHVGGSEAVWRAMRARALETATNGDVSHFCQGVARLVRRA
jgi:glycosyltransferase involved in cell wall biosynthesis